MRDRRTLILSLAFFFALNILLITLFQMMPEASAASYKQGASGDVVRQVQTKLKNWGYYVGVVDGIFGTKTTEAVKYFQRKNGLTADGIVGTRTQQALGIVSTIATGSSSYNNDLELLARLISAESRGEPYAGQVAVGAVVLNRVKHPSFPSSISGVIYQKGAFSCLDDGQFNKPVVESARKAAQDAMNGSDTSGGAIYYFNPKTATSAWIWSRPAIKTIGNHRFCA